ncbi:MAG: SGNH/GDSL hydrolase family protein [Candidatus Thorarchaeota archaeon]|jgi:lysophospholipase L1-like esterase
MVILESFVIGISLFIGIVLYCYWQMMRLPKNRPGKYQKPDNKKTVVIAGDSVTHGQVGKNYVTMISQRFDKSQFDFVNAGINSHLAWNLLQRVEEIINCRPDFVTIMIGTNDANAATSQKEAESYVKRMNLPQSPDQTWFRENLQEIVTRIQGSTNARIALISIPSLGEVPDHFAFKISSEYSKSIEEVASLTGVTYLPFHEKMLTILEHQPGNPTYPLDKARTGMVIACFKRYVLRKDWDSIGEASGFQLHIDYLHLNAKGAMIVSDLIEEFILGAT